MSADFKGQNILIIAERGPQGLQTLSVHVGFFVVLLKEQWLGEGETAFLPSWQRLYSRSNASVCTAALPALCRLQPEGFPSSESTNQHWKHDQCQRSSSGDICWGPGLASWAIIGPREAPGSGGSLPAITEANGCWGSNGHFNLPDSRFWASKRNTISWE